MFIFNFLYFLFYHLFNIFFLMINSLMGDLVSAELIAACYFTHEPIESDNLLFPE